MNACRYVWRLITALGCALLTVPVSGQPVDIEAFGKWSDSTFGKASEDGDVSAVGLVMVQGDKVVLKKTYGPASRSPDVAIDPARTRFLIGSISKSFTGLAIAQLVETGKIRSVDDPVNRYLKRIKLKGTFGDKVTIRHLLTHSAGFDQRGRDVGTAIARPDRSGAAEIERIAPLLVRTPGTLVSYSNYGTGILGIVIEDVTGQQIETYFSQNIWRPLGMTGTHFQRGLKIDSDVARAYSSDESGAWREKPFIAFHPFYWPVGAIGMTLDDASRYLRFQLATANGSNSPLLPASAHKRLRSRLLANHPAVGGFGYQMMSFVWNGQSVFGHGGTWPGYESMMLILPDQNIAIFFSITGPSRLGNLKAYNLVMSQLLGPFSPPSGLGADAPLADYEGVYRPTMRATSAIEGFLPFLGQGDGLNVVAENGGLMIGGEGPYLPAGKDLFFFSEAQTSGVNPFGTTIYGFKRGANGRVAFMTPQPGLSPLERVDAWANPSLRAMLFKYVGYALFFGLIALGWRGTRRLDWLPFVAAIVPPIAVALIPFVLTVGLGARGLEALILEGRADRFWVVFALAILTAICGLIMLYFAVLWWRGDHGIRPAWYKWSIAAIAGIQIMMVCTLWSVNLYSVP